MRRRNFLGRWLVSHTTTTPPVFIFMLSHSRRVAVHNRPFKSNWNVYSGWCSYVPVDSPIIHERLSSHIRCWRMCSELQIVQISVRFVLAITPVAVCWSIRTSPRWQHVIRHVITHVITRVLYIFDFYRTYSSVVYTRYLTLRLCPTAD